MYFQIRWFEQKIQKEKNGNIMNSFYFKFVPM